MTQMQIDPVEVSKELEAVLASTELAGAIRLQSFLRYVVEEQLAARGSSIRAKTIGEDVYGILSNQGDDPLAVVRVDAGRLRRRLEDHYNDPENTRKIRIHIDTGGYIPRFEQLASTGTDTLFDQTHTGANGTKKGTWYLLAGVVGVASVLAFFLSTNPQQKNLDDDVSKASDTAVRQALFSASPAKLQAKNLSDEARDLMFPALDRQRLMAALALFEQAIELDGQYYAGFAGAGQIYSLLASQMPSNPERDKLLSAAKVNAANAISLAPSESWAQSSMAMVAFAGKDCEEAQSISRRAISLGPDDVYTVNFDGIISLFCGDFDRAVKVTKPYVGTSELSERLVFRNVSATAEYHRGNFQETIDLYTAAIDAGEPVGALTLTYLAAASAKLNRDAQARRQLELLNEAWPNFPFEQFLLSAFADKSIGVEIISTLKEAGWKP